MAYNKKGDAKPMCSNGLTDSLFVTIKGTINKLKKRSEHLQKLQLGAVAYLLVIYYDLVLAKRYNVSMSPGFKSLGLRVNALKRKSTEY